MSLLTKPVPRRRVTPGMQVTCRVAEEVYYSGYAGQPVFAMQPGMVGIVRSVDVPYVRRAKRSPQQSTAFVLVNFQVAGRENGPGRLTTYSVALDYHNLTILNTSPAGLDLPVNPA